MLLWCYSGNEYVRPEYQQLLLPAPALGSLCRIRENQTRKVLSCESVAPNALKMIKVCF